MEFIIDLGGIKEFNSQLGRIYDFNNKSNIKSFQHFIIKFNFKLTVIKIIGSV